MPYPTPTTRESFEHYVALKKSVRYLPVEDLLDGFLYMIHARNSYLGVWDPAAKGFVLIREKFGQVYLSVERHWDSCPHLGTAKPFVQLMGPIAKEGHRAALDEAHVRFPYDRFLEETRRFAVG